MSDLAREGFAEYIVARAPGAPPIPRADLYRRFVRTHLRLVLQNALHVTREILGEEGFEEVITDFLAAGGARTSLFRDIPAEFAAWAEASGHVLADLVQHEWLEVVASRHPADLDALFATSPGLAAGLVCPNPTMQLAVYARPVHEMGPENRDPPPFADPMAFLVWRRPHTDDTVSEVTGLLLARALALASGAPMAVGDLVEHLAAEVPALSAETIRASLVPFLESLAAREGIVP